MGVYLEQSHALFNINQRLDYGLEDIEKDGTRLNPFKTLSALMCTGTWTAFLYFCIYFFCASCNIIC